MRRRLLALLLVVGMLSGCGGAGPGAEAGSGEGGGWVELGEDFVLDEAAIERVTPAPVEPLTLSQAEAQDQLPFEYVLPSWAPAGFELEEMVEVVQPASGLGYTSVSLTWVNAAEARLHLRVAQAPDETAALGATGSSEEVVVNGQPGTLVHSSRLGQARLSLSWTRGDLTYTLTAEPGTVTADELRRMAESVG